MDDSCRRAYKILTEALESEVPASQIVSALLACDLPTCADGVPFDKQEPEHQTKFRRNAMLVLNKVLLDLNRRLLDSGESSVPRRSTTGTPVPDTIFLVLFQLWGMRILPPSAATSILSLVSAVPQKALPDMLSCISSSREVTEAMRSRTRDLGSALEIASTFNNMTKRLQKGDHAELVGQTYGWLAAALPNEFRPAINLAAAVNTGHSIKIEDVPEGMTDSLGEPVKPDVYASFWRLQSSFQNMKHVLANPPNFSIFRDAVNVVLDQFASCPVRVSSKVAVHSVGDDTSAQYLSSPSLLALQVQDASFRRQILVQILIALNQIMNPGKNEKEANAKMKSFVAALEPRVIAALRATPDDGSDFTDVILRQLDDEKVWVEWKKPTPTPCPPLARPVPAAVSARLEKAKAAQRALSASLQTTSPSPASDNPRWDNLWDAAPADTMAGLDMESRGLSKNLNDMMTTVLDQMDTENPFYDPQAPKSKDDGIFNWRVLRMLVRKDVRKFARMVNKQKGDLEWMASEMFPDHAASKKWKLDEKERERKRIEEEKKRGEQERARRADESRGKGSKRPASLTTDTSGPSATISGPREPASAAQDLPDAPAAKRARQDRAPSVEKQVPASPKVAATQATNEAGSHSEAAVPPPGERHDRNAEPQRVKGNEALQPSTREREKGKEPAAAKDAVGASDSSSAKDNASQQRVVKREGAGAAKSSAPAGGTSEGAAAPEGVQTEHADGGPKPLEKARSDASRESQEGGTKRKAPGMPPPAARQPPEASKSSEGGAKSKDASDDSAPRHRKITFPGEVKKEEGKSERTQAPKSTGHAATVRGRGTARNSQ